MILSIGRCLPRNATCRSKLSMNFFVNIFLIASLLAHAVLGCCMHHAHSCVVGCAEVSAGSVESCSCSGHKHRHGEASQPGATFDQRDHDGPDQHRPQPAPHQHQCEGDSCNFAGTESFPQLDLGDAGDFLTFLMPPSCDFVLSTKSSDTASHCLSPDIGAGTPRLHLVLGVLLI